MKIRCLELKNYRKYAEGHFEFGPNLNIICGNNAVGKSTLLEAIHYLVLLRSPKTHVDIEQMSHSAEETVIKGVFYGEKTEKKPIVLISKYFKKMSLDRKLMKRSSDYVGFADVVSFGTEDVYALTSSPGDRRKMIDVFGSQYDPEYMGMLRKFKNILKEKNAMLKQIDEWTNNDRLLFEVVNQKYYELAKELTIKRKIIINKINELIKDIHYTISGQEELCYLVYDSSVDRNLLSDNVNDITSKDLKLKISTVGPHRDDIWFYVNTENLTMYGSQGQKKTAVLSFKMTCVKMLSDAKNRKPIVLLDDVFGELDSNRQNCLLKFVKNDIQTFITTPSLVDIDKKIIERANVIYLEKEEI